MKPAWIYYRWLNPMVWWRRRLRSIDRDILLPSFLELAGNRDLALRGFGLHVRTDPAWAVPAWEYTDEEFALVREIGGASSDGDGESR